MSNPENCFKLKKFIEDDFQKILKECDQQEAQIKNTNVASVIKQREKIFKRRKEIVT